MKSTLKRWILDLAMKTPLVTWVFLGFLVVYLLFFIRPIFFSAPTMQFFKYLPAEKSIGVDLGQILSYSRSWFIDKQSPYIGNNLYPPLASVLFTPLLFVSFASAYRIITLITLAGFVGMTVGLPLWIAREWRVASMLVLILFTGLFSYGLQFELERGQFNVLAVSLCFLGLWIFHARPRVRLLAYILFIISVQLKVYPLIFIVLFIQDWQDWKNNLKRMAGLVLANIALLFILGPQVFLDFIKGITSQTTDPAVWTGNHSAASFIADLAEMARLQGTQWPERALSLARLFLLVLVVLLVFYVLVRAYRQKKAGLDPYLFLACTIGALVIPPVSHDYTLPILAAPVAYLFSSSSFWERQDAPRQRILFIELIFIFAAAYASTLFSYTNKPPVINNNFPALLIILLIAAVLTMPVKAPVSVETAAPVLPAGEPSDVRP